MCEGCGWKWKPFSGWTGWIFFIHGFTWNQPKTGMEIRVPTNIDKVIKAFAWRVGVYVASYRFIGNRLIDLLESRIAFVPIRAETFYWSALPRAIELILLLKKYLLNIRNNKGSNILTVQLCWLLLSLLGIDTEATDARADKYPWLARLPDPVALANCHLCRAVLLLTCLRPSGVTPAVGPPFNWQNTTYEFVSFYFIKRR